MPWQEAKAEALAKKKSAKAAVPAKKRPIKATVYGAKSLVKAKIVKSEVSADCNSSAVANLDLNTHKEITHADTVTLDPEMTGVKLEIVLEELSDDTGVDSIGNQEQMAGCARAQKKRRGALIKTWGDGILFKFCFCQK